MNFTSKSGLIPNVRSAIRKSDNECQTDKIPHVELQIEVNSVPLSFKPFSTYYNPYKKHCSILCRHPLQSYIQDENGPNEKLPSNKKNSIWYHNEDVMYVEKASPMESLDKCVLISSAQLTDRSIDTLSSDPFSVRSTTPKLPLQKRTLILDLRRKYGQEIEEFSSDEDIQNTDRSIEPMVEASSSDFESSRRNRHVQLSVDYKNQVDYQEPNAIDGKSKPVRRRGKKLKKSKTESATSCIHHQNQTDPETQITISDEDQTLSILESKMKNQSILLNTIDSQLKKLEQFTYLDYETLKYFRQYLEANDIETELRPHRKIALEEAFKVLSNANLFDKNRAQNRLNFDKNIDSNGFDSNENLKAFLNYPRRFKRRNCRFELPSDFRLLSTMSILNYGTEHTHINEEIKTLYKCIYNQVREENGLLFSKNVHLSLNYIMGEILSTDEVTHFCDLIELRNDAVLDFRSFCGIGALCERILGFKYNKFGSLIQDQPHELETKDFQFLERKLSQYNIPEHFATLLRTIAN